MTALAVVIWAAVAVQVAIVAVPVQIGRSIRRAVLPRGAMAAPAMALPCWKDKHRAAMHQKVRVAPIVPPELTSAMTHHVQIARPMVIGHRPHVPMATVNRATGHRLHVPMGIVRVAMHPVVISGAVTIGAHARQRGAAMATRTARMRPEAILGAGIAPRTAAPMVTGQLGIVRRTAVPMRIALAAMLPGVIVLPGIGPARTGQQAIVPMATDRAAMPPGVIVHPMATAQCAMARNPAIIRVATDHFQVRAQVPAHVKMVLVATRMP